MSRCCIALSAILAVCTGRPEAAEEPGQDAGAADALRLAGVEAGLCVHLGCGDGRLTAALARGSRLLVHGLNHSRDAVAAARRYIESQGLYGQAAVDCAGLARLPYADDLATLVVVDDVPGAMAAGLSLEEVVRILRPGGVACLRGDAPEMAKLGRVEQRGEWRLFRKPRPAAMGEWTHRAYDASGNCVSRDAALRPLGGLRWIAGPAWPMGTGYQVSNGGLLAAGGRVFNVTLNELSNSSRVPQTRNNTWFLTARDAFSGLLLWSRPIERPMRHDGQELGNAIVATAGRLYAVLGSGLVALDPATGKTLATHLQDVGPNARLALCDGLLVLAEPSGVRALAAASGELRWKQPVSAGELVADDGRAFVTTARQAELVCLDLASGAERWRVGLDAIQGKKKELLFAKGGIVAFVWERNWQVGENGIAAFAADDGRRLWSLDYASSRATWPDAVWFAQGLVWHRTGAAGLAGLDPLTGQEKRRITLKGGYCGGCVRNIATETYLVGTRPLNFFDWDDGEAHGFRGGRHPCRAGVVVANGLLYTQPHGCKCVRESLRGFIAFAPASAPAPPPTERLQRGPAFSTLRTPHSALRNSEDWPTFRHDPRRSGSTVATVPAELGKLWEVRVDDQHMPPSPLADDWLANPLGGDRATAPVVAGGMAFVGLTDSHRVVALDAASGQPRWSYTAGGRVDVPPTLHEGLCLLGCTDGWVYCLRAMDGQLAWRFRAAPHERRIVAFGQLESLWPVVGGVLVENDAACFVAGRSSATDGGLTGYALRPQTGEVVWAKPLPGAVSDLLVSDGDALRMAGGASAGLRINAQTGQPLKDGLSSGFNWDYAGKLKTLWGGPNRVLDRTWHVLSVNDTASHWMRIKQGYGPHQGHLLVAAPDGKRIFGFRFRYVHWSKVNDPATEFGGELVAWEGGKEAWKVDVPGPSQVEALALAGDVLFAAGPTDRLRRQPGGKLWALSAKDGKLLREHALDARPAADGLAAAEGRLYLTTHDGRLLCFGRKE
ncbi:MAG TPA: PQQ-binding-like beta-propeller repeat protein [Planctomycetota bacterium]|nr:PQQ-binding-like beta-propeller repeat protein [Planctomycetota bacterium]